MPTNNTPVLSAHQSSPFLKHEIPPYPRNDLQTAGTKFQITLNKMRNSLKFKDYTKIIFKTTVGLQVEENIVVL